MNRKNPSYWQNISKYILIAWMAIVIPASCGGSDSSEEKTEPKDTTAPVISIEQPEVDVSGGKYARVSGDYLYIGDGIAASWKDDSGKSCIAQLAYNGQDIGSWSTLDDEGTLSLTVTDPSGNASNAEICLTAKPVLLRDFSLQVDQEVNLLDIIVLGKGVELIKIEIEKDGETTEIADLAHFIPQYPGTCNIIISVKLKDGTMTECKAEDLTIKPLDYADGTLEAVDIIKETYPWYNNLQQSTKDFIYPHILASYAACNWSKLDNRVHIIMGETADDIENIWSYDVWGWDHAYEWYYRMRAISPDVDIKGCADEWNILEQYINEHPDNIFFVSCAADTWGGGDWDALMRNQDTQPQRNILEKENVFVIDAGGNRIEISGIWKVFCENVRDGYKYKSASINSKLNNKITVVGYNSWEEGNYFCPIEYGGLESAMPVGFDKDKGNIVMPMIPLISSDTNGKESYSTASSFPTAVTSAVVGNAVSVVMANHPGITAEDAMTIIVNQYLREETFQYMDETTNGQLVDGGKWYFIEIQHLLDHELLQADQLNTLQLSADEVELPFSQGLCYAGIGVQFEYKGQRYDCIEANLSTLKEALKSGSIKWYWNKDRFRKYGGKDSTTLKAYIMDCNYNSIPDLQLEVTKNIQ